MKVMPLCNADFFLYLLSPMSTFDLEHYNIGARNVVESKFLKNTQF
jgi:hypothetical protein